MHFHFRVMILGVDPCTYHFRSLKSGALVTPRNWKGGSMGYISIDEGPMFRQRFFATFFVRPERRRFQAENQTTRTSRAQVVPGIWEDR